MKPLQIVFDGLALPKEHMEKDAQLLAEGTDPLLRLYTWPWPSCTWGVFTDPEKLLVPGALELIPHARRPTGGGLLFHGRDLAFSLFLPEGHPCLSESQQKNYDRINGAALQAILPLLKPEMSDSQSILAKGMSPSPSHFCQAKATIYDLLLGAKKIGGSSERRTKRGLLHQSSLFLYPPDWDLMCTLVQDKEQVRQMQLAMLSVSEIVKEHSSLELSVLLRCFQNVFGSFEDMVFSDNV